MRHRLVGKKLNRNEGERNSLRKNLVRSLVTYGQIETTLAKAKFIAPYVEHMITRARAGGLTAIRYVMSLLQDPDLTKVFLEKVVPAMAGRAGGYTRITKLGPRVGDAAELVRLEWSVKVEEKPTAVPSSEAVSKSKADK
ncbi:MAG: 50S ribosomal protein L17 [bacterium]|nr:50S ribosomal protein L17 [bacterium]